MINFSAEGVQRLQRISRPVRQLPVQRQNQDFSAGKGICRKNARLNGGGGGIRTHETLSGLTVFKTAAFNRSATPPKIKSLLHCSLGTASVTVLGAPEVLRRTLLRIERTGSDACRKCGEEISQLLDTIIGLGFR